MTDEELYGYAQQIWAAVERGGWDTAVVAARRLADRAVAETPKMVEDTTRRAS